MANSASFLDYVGYFFQGYKTESMNQAVLAVLRGIHYVIIAFVGAVLASVLYNVASGKNVWDLATWQTALTSGVILVLGIVNEAIRKYLNPAVSVKSLPAHDQLIATNTISHLSPLEQQLGVKGEQAGAHQTLPHVHPVDIPPSS